MKLSHLTIGAALVALPFAAVSAIGQDAAPEPVPLQEFADKAASSNLLEIQSSELAIERSSDAEIVEFAEQMIVDHTAAGDEMMAAAQQDGITPTTTLAPDHQTILDRLEAAEDDAFDQAYVEAQITAHDEAVALFETFATGDPDGALKAFAVQTLPTLVQHQEHIHSIAEAR